MTKDEKQVLVLEWKAEAIELGLFFTTHILHLIAFHEGNGSIKEFAMAVADANKEFVGWGVKSGTAATYLQESALDIEQDVTSTSFPAATSLCELKGKQEKGEKN